MKSIVGNKFVINLLKQRNGMCVQPMDVFGSVRMANAKEEKRSMPALASMPPDPVDEHPLMGPEVSPHERFLIHLPVPQTNEYRSECNQR